MDDKQLLALIGRVDVETPGVPMVGLLRDEVKVGDYQARLLAIARAVQAAERERCIAIVRKWRDAYPSEDGTRDALDELGAYRLNSGAAEGGPLE